MDVVPITLEGAHVRLAPLRADHHAALCEVGLDEELWRWTADRVVTPSEMQRYLEQALAAQAAGSALPFVTIERCGGRIIGSTRFAAIEPGDRRVEIGWTFVARPWQRTAVNTEAKYLMLRHAFETWGCMRVELKTDALNERSRAAIVRIGATQEGILRQHALTATGRRRDTVYYSILDHEWPAVKTALEAKLRGNGRPNAV